MIGPNPEGKSGLNAERNLNPQRRRVIIAEDDDFLASLYAFVIEKHYPHTEIKKLINGDDVWRELSQADPDLLITDVQHPGTDVWETLALLAAAKVTYPILMTSGEIQPGVEYENVYPGLKLTLMSKPFHLIDLLKYLTGVFGSSVTFIALGDQIRPNDSTRGGAH